MAKKRTRRRIISDIDTENIAPRLNLKPGIRGILDKLQKHYGDRLYYVANSRSQPRRIPTGIFILDFALLGGIPQNRITMVIGNKSAGKSSMAYLLIANAQKMYPEQSPVIIDVEGTFDPTWATVMGVDIESLPIVEPASGEEAIDTAYALALERDVSLLVIDSLPALVPTTELDASAEDNFVGLQARLIGSMLRKLASALINQRRRNGNITILLINQFRSRIGGPPNMSPNVTPGGRAVEYYTSLQLTLKNREEQETDERGIKTTAYNKHSFQVTKNKINKGIRTGEFLLRITDDEKTGLREGEIDDKDTLLAYAKKFGYYKGGGRKWVLSVDGYDSEFVNSEKTIEALRQEPELAWSLRNQIIVQQAKDYNMHEEFIETIDAFDPNG